MSYSLHSYLLNSFTRPLPSATTVLSSGALGKQHKRLPRIFQKLQTSRVSSCSVLHGTMLLQGDSEIKLPRITSRFSSKSVSLNLSYTSE